MGDDSSSPPRDRNEEARFRRWLVEAVGLVLPVTVVVTILQYRLWRLSPRVPLRNGDAKTYEMLFKHLHETGWWLHSDRLNAPFGQDMHDFPFGGETLQLVLAKLVMVIARGDSGLGLNLYFFGTFPLVAMAAFIAARALGLRRMTGLGVGLLYTFLPYHFWHDQAHLFRVGYITAPITVLLLIGLLAPRPPGLSDSSGSVRSRLRRHEVVLLVLAAVTIGLWETMAAAFAVALLVSVGALAAMVYRQRNRLVLGLGLAALVGVTVLLGNLATLRYRSEFGTNPESVARPLGDTERYALRPAAMLLPEHTHRVDALSEVGLDVYRTDFFRGAEGGQSLGLVGVIGLGGALWFLVTRGLRSEPSPIGRGSSPPLEHHGLIILVAVFWGTVGGFSLITSLFGLEEIRTWNRIVVVIGFSALVAAGSLFESLAGRLSSSRPRPVLLGVSGVALLGVALLDVLPEVPPDYAARDVEYGTDRAFVQAIESELPTGSSILQLPLVPFPEVPPIVSMADYSHFIGYLHSEDLRWSYGGVRGREEAGWQQRLGLLPTAELVEIAAAFGFEGVYIDRFAYEDRAGALESEMLEYTTTPPLVSADGRHSFFTLNHPELEEIRELPLSERAALGIASVGIAPPA